MSLGIRLRGLILSVVCIGIACVLVANGVGIRVSGGPFHRAPIAALPAVFGLVGLIELVSGYPLHKVAARWDAMPWLVRFGLGLVIVAFLLAAMIWAADVFYLNG